jgi:predicted ATPase
MLCWAIILLSPKLPQLLVIEEPEIGIHPAWLKVLASWIKRAASRTQVIISTHHPDLLDHLTDQLEHILVMEESSSERHRFFGHRINQAGLSDALSEGWLLGDLYRVGEPRIGGWPW